MNKKFERLTSIKSTTFSILILLVLVRVAFSYVFSSHLSNESDGFFINANTYIYGANNVIDMLAFVPFITVCLFLKEIILSLKNSIFRILKKEVVAVVEVPRYKIIVFVVVFCLLFLSVLCVGSVEVLDDCILIKEDIFFPKETKVYYEDLKEYDLFVYNDNDVCWGKRTERVDNTVSYDYNYDVYLGKLENNEKLLNLLSEKSGRKLMPN